MPAKSEPKEKNPHLFQKGKSGNPKGRPQGSRHRATIAALALLEGESGALTRKAVDMALQGDIAALRLCLERILSPARDRPVKITLPAVSTAADLPLITAALLAAVAAGEIGASEAAALGKLVEAHRGALELADLDERLKKLEATNDES